MSNLLKNLVIALTLPTLLFNCYSESENEETNKKQEFKIENKKYEVELIEVESNKEYMPEDTTAKMSPYETKKFRIEQQRSIEKNYVINYDYVFSSMNKNTSMSASLIESLKIKGKTNPWHDNFEYYMLDTLELEPGITTFVVIQYYNSESMGFLFNYVGTTFIDKLKVFYNNAEGCWSDNSVILETNLIYIENYDCTKEKQKQEQENFLYIITNKGKFEEIILETT
jgi:hypothetical protein